MNADAAMYKAKEAGRDNVQFYTAEMNTRVHEKLALQQEMRDGLARSEFILHYQPQVDLRTRPHLRRRSPGPLAASHPRAPVAAQIHSPGRGNRTDRAARRLGPSRSLPAEQGLAGRGLAAHECLP